MLTLAKFREMVQEVDNDSKGGGYLVPPQYWIQAALNQGMEQPPSLGVIEAAQAAIDAKPWWWCWLYRRCWHNWFATRVVAYFVRSVFAYHGRLSEARCKQLRYECDLAQTFLIELWGVKE